MTFPTEWRNKKCSKPPTSGKKEWSRHFWPHIGMVFMCWHRVPGWNDPFFHSGSRFDWQNAIAKLPHPWYLNELLAISGIQIAKAAKVMSFFPPSFADLCTNTTQNMKIQCFNSNFPHNDDPTQWLLTEGGQGPFHAQNGPTTRENENESLNFEDMEDVATLEENHLRIWAFRVTKVGIVPWRSYRLIKRLIDMQNPWINSDRIWNRQSLRIGCCTYRFIYG